MPLKGDWIVKNIEKRTIKRWIAYQVSDTLINDSTVQLQVELNILPPVGERIGWGNGEGPSVGESLMWCHGKCMKEKNIWDRFESKFSVIVQSAF